LQSLGLKSVLFLHQFYLPDLLGLSIDMGISYLWPIKHMSRGQVHLLFEKSLRLPRAGSLPLLKWTRGRDRGSLFKKTQLTCSGDPKMERFLEAVILASANMAPTGCVITACPSNPMTQPTTLSRTSSIFHTTHTFAKSVQRLRRRLLLLYHLCHPSLTRSRCLAPVKVIRPGQVVSVPHASRPQ
jgi:hypothetical protein